jgi:hypothetical protein
MSGSEDKPFHFLSLQYEREMIGKADRSLVLGKSLVGLHASAGCLYPLPSRKMDIEKDDDLNSAFDDDHIHWQRYQSVISIAVVSVTGCTIKYTCK